MRNVVVTKHPKNTFAALFPCFHPTLHKPHEKIRKSAAKVFFGCFVTTKRKK